MPPADFRGIIPYLVTPLDEGGDVDEAALRRLVEHLIDAGVHGLSPLGSTGETMYLDQRQRDRVVTLTVAAAGGRVPVLPGVAAFSSRDACDQARRCADLGADGIVAIQQVYFPVGVDGAVSYFADIARATPLPVVLYTNPVYGADLSTEAVVRLAEHETVLYLKDASGITGRMLSVQARLGDRIRYFAASAHIPAVVFELGGVGWMAGPACVAPRAAVALWDAYVAERTADLWSLQRALWPLNELFARHSLAAFVKFALNRQGLAVGDPVPPQRPIDPSVGAELDAVLRSIDNAIARRT